MTDRAALVLSVLILMTWPLTAAGQTDEPTETAPDPLGVWEGYTSYGYLVHLENVGNPDGSITTLVQTYLYGPTDSPSFETDTYTIESVGPTHSRFRNPSDGTTVDVYWYGPDAVRLATPDGMEMILARVVYGDNALGGNPFASLPPITPPPEAEELLQSLEGIWQGSFTVYAGAYPQEATVEFRILDLPTGRFVATISARDGVTTSDYQVISATVDSFAARTPTGYDYPVRIKFAEPTRIEVSTTYGDSQMMLERVSGLPPEAGGESPE